MLRDLPSATRHLPSAIRHLPSTIRHLPSAICGEGRVLWVVTIVLALVGHQVLTAWSDNDLALGLLLLGLAALGLLALRRRAEAFETPEEPLPSQSAGASSTSGDSGRSHRDWVTWAIAGLALVTSAAALVSLDGRKADAPCWDVFALWVASIALALMSGLAAETSKTSGRAVIAWLRAHRGEILLVAGITLVGLLLRIVAVDTIPPTLGGDEGSQGLEAIRFLDGKVGNMFVTGWLGVPTMSFLCQAATLWLFGRTVFALRVLWVLVGTATLPLLYILVRQLFDRWTALVATAFLAIYHYHIHYSRLGSNQVADALLLTGGLAALVWGLQASAPVHLQNGARRWRGAMAFVLSGVVAGLGMYFYAGARLVPVLLIAVLLVMFLAHPRQWRLPWNRLVLLALGFLVTAAPMLLLAVQRPDEFNARLSAVGIVQSGWLDKRMTETGQPLEIILGEVALRTALAFNHYWDRTYWYGLHGPLLDVVPAALYVLGFVYALFHWRARRYAIPVLWVALVAVGGVAMTENPPSSQRLVGAAPALAVLVAVGLVRLADMGRSLWGGRPAVWRAAQALVVCAMAAISVNLYFVDYTPQHIYGNPNGQATTILAYYLRDNPADRIAYFFGAPRLYYGGFNNIPYLAPGVPGVDINEPLGAPPYFVDPDHDALFVFVPERLNEREWVELALPNGIWHFLPDHLGETILAMYEVPRAELQVMRGGLRPPY